MMDSRCSFASQGAGSTDIFSPEEVMRGHTHLRACSTQAGARIILETRGLGVKAEQTVVNAVFRNMGQGGAGGVSNFEVVQPVEIQPLCPA